MTNRFGMVLLLVTGAFIGGPYTVALAHEGANHACHDLDNKPVGYDNVGACCYDPAQDGPSNTNGYPYCPAVLDQVPGGEQYSKIDRATLAHTHICRPGVDCGPPIELTNVKPFYGNAGAPPPPAPPAYIPPPPTPVIAPPPVVAVAPPPVFIPPAPVGVATAGLGNAGLLAAGLGAAALIGVIALAAGGDDDNNSASGTR